MSFITWADMYGGQKPNTSKVGDEKSGVLASGAKELRMSQVNNSHMFIVLVLILVIVRIAYDYMPSS